MSEGSSGGDKVGNGFGNAFKGFGDSLRTMGQQASEAANKAAAAASKIASEHELNLNVPLKVPRANDNNQVSTPVKKTSDSGSSDKVPPSQTPTPLKAGGFKPEQASREELLDVLGKLHKKTKQISALRLQQQKRAEQAEQEKERLMELLKNEILNVEDIDHARVQLGSESGNEVELITLAWRKMDENRSLMMGQIQNEFKVNSMKIQAETEDRMRNEMFEKIELAKAELNQQHSMMLAAELERQKVGYETELRCMKVSVEDLSAKTSGGEMIDELKKVHADEIKKLEEDFQMKIEQQKDKFLNEIAEINKESEISLAGCKEENEILLEEKLNELKQSLSKDFNIQIDDLQEKLASCEQSRAETMASLEKGHRDNVQKIQEVNELNAREKEKILEEKDNLQLEIKQIKLNHQLELNRLKEEVIVPLEQDIESLRESQHLMITSAAEAHLEEINALKQDIESSKNHTTELNELVAKYDSEKETLRSQLTETFQREIEQLKVEQQNADRMSQDSINSVINDKDKEIEVIKNQLEQKFRDEIACIHENSILKTDHLLAMSEVEKRLESARSDISEQKNRADKSEKLLEALKSEHENEIAQIRECFSNESSSLRDSLDREKLEALASLQNDLTKTHEAALNDFKQMHESKDSLVVTSKDSKIRSLMEAKEQAENDYELKIDGLNAELQRSKEELDTAKENFSRELELIENRNLEGSKQDTRDLLDKQRISFDSKISQMTKKHGEEMEIIQKTLAITQNNLNAAELSLQEKSAAIEDIAQKDAKLEKDNLNLLTEINAARAQEGDLTRTIVELRQALTTNENKFLSELESKEQRISDLITSISQKDDALQTNSGLKSELEDLNMRLSGLQDQLQQVESEKLQMASAVDEARVREAEQEEALKQLRGNLESKEQRISDLITSISQKDDALQTNSGLKSELEDLNMRLSGLQDQLQQVESEKLQMASAVDEARVREAEQEEALKKLRDEADFLANDVTNGSNVVKEEYEIKLKEKIDFISSIELENKSRIQQLNDALAQRNITIENLTKNLSESQKRYENFVESNDAFARNEEEFMAKERFLSSEVDNLRNKVKEVESERDTISVTFSSKIDALNNSANEKIASLHQQIESLTKDKDEIKTKHEQELADLKARVRSGIASYKDEISALKESLNNTEARNESYITEIRQLKASEGELLSRMKEIETTQAEGTSGEEKIKAQYEGEIQELGKEIEKLKVILHDKKVVVESLQEQIASNEKVHSDSMEALKVDFEHKLSVSNEEISNQSKIIVKLNEELGSVKEELTNKNSTIMRFKEDIESYHKVERSLKDKVSDLETSLKESIANSRSTATSLIQRQEVLENENAKLNSQLNESNQKEVDLRDRFSDLLSQFEALKVSKEEALENEGEKFLKSKHDLEGRILSLTKQLATAREETTTLNSDYATLENTISRMKSEKDASERRHGQRTALVGMLETQLSELKEENDRRKLKLDDALSTIDEKESNILQLEKKLDAIRVDLAQKNEALEEASSKNNASIEVAKKDVEARHRSQLESLQQQMARKSAAAQKLLQQREQECSELRKTNKIMKIELESGSSSDRHIFELAAKQSNRDSLVASEIEIREQILNKLKEALSLRDAELAAAEKAVNDVQLQVEDLCRIKRREDVNLDYLKSIIVKFLSLPTGSNEKASLLPVLATLLQFDDEDYKTIDQGKNKVDWFWGTIIPTSISAPVVGSATALNNESVTHSNRGTVSEIKVSGITTNAKSNESAQVKSRTALQF